MYRVVVCGTVGRGNSSVVVVWTFSSWICRTGIYNVLQKKSTKGEKGDELEIISKEEETGRDETDRTLGGERIGVRERTRQ